MLTVYGSGTFDLSGHNIAVGGLSDGGQGSGGTVTDSAAAANFSVSVGTARPTASPARSPAASRW